MYTMCMPIEILAAALAALEQSRSFTTLEDFEQYYNCTVQRVGSNSTTMYRDVRFNSESSATFFLLRFS